MAFLSLKKKNPSWKIKKNVSENTLTDPHNWLNLFEFFDKSTFCVSSYPNFPRLMSQFPPHSPTQCPVPIPEVLKQDTDNTALTHFTYL